MAPPASAASNDVPVHPVVRNALRVSFTESEYRVLHKRLIKRLPQALQEKAFSPSQFDSIVKSPDRYNEAAVRHALRVFLGTAGGMKLVEAITKRIAARRGQLVTRCAQQSQVVALWDSLVTNSISRTSTAAPVPYLRSPGFRLALSLSTLLLFHRLLYRFFSRLRTNLRTDDARPFRDRNPKISKALTSRYAPAIGASLAGFLLSVYPQNQLRITAAIYAATRSLEFVYNVLDEKGWIKDKPWWFGSWLLMPLSTAQLFHAFIFDRETTPGVR